MAAGSGFEVSASLTLSGEQQRAVPTLAVLQPQLCTTWDVWGTSTSSSTQVSEIPGPLLGSLLLQSSVSSPGSQVTVTAASDARIYCIAEVPTAGPTPPGSSSGEGSLAGVLASAPRWLPEEQVPAWTDASGRRAFGVSFSTFAPKGVPVSLPEVKHSEPGSSSSSFLFVAPVAAGSFTVAVHSSSGSQYSQTALMQEGVVAWADRDHCFMDVPEYLVGGILFQGPHKDIPEGTVLTVRPNSAARVYLLMEERSPGLQAGLAGWQQEKCAPRWLDRPSMVAFSRYCPAGWAAVLPPTGAPGSSIFSIVVVPEAGQATAPLEVSACHGPCDFSQAVAQDAAAHSPTQELSFIPLAALEFLPVSEGLTVQRGKRSGQLAGVPLWLVGATFVRLETPDASIAEALESGQRRIVCTGRSAAPSVFYALVDASADEKALTAAGWERRQEAPDWIDGGTKVPLAVYAKRVRARESLCIPPLPNEDSKSQLLPEVIAVIVKVDVEAFDAAVETSSGLELARTAVAETGMIWTDRQNRLAWVPPCMKGGLLFRGPFDAPYKPGTVFKISGSSAFRAYCIVEVKYSQKKELARNGAGLPQLLLEAGWRRESSAAPAWGDPASTMQVFSIRCAADRRVELPPLPSPSGADRPRLLLMLAVVNIASSPDRLEEELKDTFKTWDSQGQGGLKRDDLVLLLKKFCPKLDEAGLNAVVEQASQAPLSKKSSSSGYPPAGVVSHEDFLEKLFLFGAAGERQGQG
eukprot:TRINITY_DN76567_c0_g1_i1.p1 TRINITY_DN76567_c0_g1~~TRINITY_DN76567_c0_g1_i1.p1  ORF type:complete len:761 (+),score=147.25 TRINITY_DN76567_c0_g1_i1:39-2285(+)